MIRGKKKPFLRSNEMSKTKNSYIAKFPFREVFTFDTIKSAIKVVKSAQEAFEMEKNFKRKSREKETPKIEEETLSIIIY